MPFPRSSPLETRWVAFIFGLLALLAFLLSSYSVIRSEVTREAIYSSGPRGMIKEHITKESDPTKFREVISQGWLMISVTGIFTWICFYFFRRLS